MFELTLYKFATIAEISQAARSAFQKTARKLAAIRHKIHKRRNPEYVFFAVSVPSCGDTAKRPLALLP